MSLYLAIHFYNKHITLKYLKLPRWVRDLRVVAAIERFKAWQLIVLAFYSAIIICLMLTAKYCHWHHAQLSRQQSVIPSVSP